MIFAKDLDVLVAFYRQGFGLHIAEAESEPGYCVLTGQGIRLAIHAIPDHIASTIELTDPPGARSNTPIKLLFGVDDVAATTERLGALGASLLEVAADGARDALDPEGNVFRVHAWAGPDGRS